MNYGSLVYPAESAEKGETLAGGQKRASPESSDHGERRRKPTVTRTQDRSGIVRRSSTDELRFRGAAEALGLEAEDVMKAGSQQQRDLWKSRRRKLFEQRKRAIGNRTERSQRCVKSVGN